MMAQVPPEELARARIYRLLARLFGAPPDEVLLEAIAEASDVDAQAGTLVDPWIALTAVAARTDADAVAREFASALAGRRRTERLGRFCEAMARAIDPARADPQLDLDAQACLFREVLPSLRRTCGALARRRGFYRALALFADSFFRVEDTAFQLQSTTGAHSHDAARQAPIETPFPPGSRRRQRRHRRGDRSEAPGDGATSVVR